MSAAVMLPNALRLAPRCAYCGKDFVPRAPGQRFDTDVCRERAKYERRSTSPAYRLGIRKRCAAWAAEHRGVTSRNAWLLGAPVCEPFLPGGFLELYSDTPLKWPLEHRNVRGLHGAITALTGQDHDPVIPRFALVPWHRGVGWGVYLGSGDLLAQLAGARREMRLYEQALSVRFGGAVRIKAPVVDKRGRRRLRVDTLTPVCTRETGGVAHQRASAGNLLSTLCAWLPRRLGVVVGDDDARLEVVENDTHPAHVPLGGKFGVVSGWTGSMDVETNAVGEWLLRAGEVAGVGGRVAFGFGRIQVSTKEQSHG